MPACASSARIGSCLLASSHLIFSPHNWLSMAIVWVLLKIAHELAHALACKRYGGEVRDMGLVFILFAPAAYVDVTSCWRFSSKWQRMHVAAAGMYVELVLAAMAAIAWSQTDSLVVRHWLFNVILMASVSTLLFNANPLMRFDGYYLLADLLEIPNLSPEGSRFVQQLGSRIFFGSRPAGQSPLGWRGCSFACYGLAAWLWRLAVCGSLLAASAILWQGAGLMLGLAEPSVGLENRCWNCCVRSIATAMKRPCSWCVPGWSRPSWESPWGRPGVVALAGNDHRAGHRGVHRPVDRPQRSRGLRRTGPCLRRAAGRGGRLAAGTEKRRPAVGNART